MPPTTQWTFMPLYSLCILVSVYPQAYAYNKEDRRAQVGYESLLTKLKWAPILFPILVRVEIAGTTPIANSALIVENNTLGNSVSG